MSHACPLCRLPLRIVGRVAIFEDNAGQWWGFNLCHVCTSRLDRLPIRLQGKQLDCAIATLEKHPERYELRAFENEAAAKIFMQLEVSRLRGEIKGLTP